MPGPQQPAASETAPGLQQIVPSVIADYLEAIKHRIKPSTYGVYLRYLENHIAPYFEGVACSQLNPKAVQDFIGSQALNGLSAATSKTVLGFLKKGLGGVLPVSMYAVDMPGLESCRIDVTIDEQKRLESRRIDVLTIDEQKRLEAAVSVSDATDRVGITLCLYTGIRIGELCGLMWGDIDFPGRQMHVRRTAQRVRSAEGGARTQVVLLEPHNSQSGRSIPLQDFVLKLLWEHRPLSLGGHVLSRNGEAIEPRNMQYRFKRLLKSAGIRPVPFQATRHTFAARALESGFDLGSLSEILGHSSPAVTLKTYGHLLSAEDRKRLGMDSLAAIHK